MLTSRRGQLRSHCRHKIQNLREVNYGIKSNQGRGARRSRRHRSLLVLVTIFGGAAATVSRREKGCRCIQRACRLPELRASIKSQYSGRLAEKFGNAADSGSDFAKLGVAFENFIGKAVVSPMVDALVRPETLMRAMLVGRFSETVTDELPNETPAQSAVNPGTPNSVEPEYKNGKVKWTYERQGVDKVTAYVTARMRPDEQNQNKLGLVLHRSGFATWKLTEVRLPGMN